VILDAAGLRLNRHPHARDDRQIVMSIMFATAALPQILSALAPQGANG
jgi:hypothetical protein